MNPISIAFHVFVLITACASYKILAVFPYNGRSHHIFYSTLIEELASKKHEVTVVNYFPVKKMSNLYQIHLENNHNGSDAVNIEDHLKGLPSNLFIDLYKAFDSARAFEHMANTNCEKLITNKDVQKVVNEERFDLVIVEQFVTDCGLALAHKLNAPMVGMTAHVLMPWTYSRLGAPNNPTFVPNHFFASGSKPDLWSRIKSVLINTYMNMYYRMIIQKNDYEIVKKVYPETPDLESIGKNISLIMLNQYFPLTGSRLNGANVVEIGGMHIKEVSEKMSALFDKELENFLNSANSDVVYISFGTVAKNFPRRLLNEIINFIRKSNMKFIWKVDGLDSEIPKNTLVRKWLPQPAILCHPNVVAFVTHSGMLSTAEAMHCGVPLVSVPLFGDQFANAQSAVENGLGVAVDLRYLNENILSAALKTVLTDRYQKRAKELSKLWKDRPMSPLNTAVYWIEYVARHGASIDMKPSTVDLPLYQYLMLDITLIIVTISVILIYVLRKLIVFFIKKNSIREVKTESKKKKQ